MFSDQDLARLKFALENHAPNWFDKDNLTGLISRLEAAEQVIVDIAYPDHGFFNELGFRKQHYEAWRTSAGK